MFERIWLEDWVPSWITCNFMIFELSWYRNLARERETDRHTDKRREKYHA